MNQDNQQKLNEEIQTLKNKTKFVQSVSCVWIFLTTDGVHSILQKSHYLSIMQPLATQLFTSTCPTWKSNNLGYNVPSTAPSFDLGRNPLSYRGLFGHRESVFLLPWFSGKTRSAEQLWHVYENERKKKKTCVDADNLLRKEDQQLSLFLEFQVSYSSLFPVWTPAAPTHNPNYRCVGGKEAKKE